MSLANLIGLERSHETLPAPRPQRVLVPVRGRRRGWSPTDSSPLFSGWGGTTASGDEQVRHKLELERARARELEESNPWTVRFYGLFVINVVGHTGIKLVPRVMRTEQNEEGDPVQVPDGDANEKLRVHWDAWGKRKVCTVDGRLSWLGVQIMLARSWQRDGEVLLRKYRGGEFGPYGFQVQPFEADLLPLHLTKDLTNGNRIHMGIERNRFDRPIAYWLARRHPGDRSSIRIPSATLQSFRTEDFERVPAEEIVHLYSPKRLHQSRGLPTLESTVAGLSMMQGYEQAEVVAARAASSKMGFLKTAEGVGAGGYAGAGEALEVTETETIEALDPGTIEVLDPGFEFQSFDPQHPTTAFAPFLKYLLRRFVGATGGAGYPSVANDLEGVNLSSLRSARLEERDFWKMDQQTLVDCVLEDVYPDWLAQAFLVPGLLGLPVLDQGRFQARTWQGRRWEWIDPLKQVQANEGELDNLTATLTEIAQEKGRTVREILEEIKAELALAKEFGLEDLLPYFQARRNAAPATEAAPSGDPSPGPADDGEGGE